MKITAILLTALGVAGVNAYDTPLPPRCDRDYCLKTMLDLKYDQAKITSSCLAYHAATALGKTNIASVTPTPTPEPIPPLRKEKRAFNDPPGHQLRKRAAPTLAMPPTACSNPASIWVTPAGGEPTKTMTGGVVRYSSACACIGAVGPAETTIKEFNIYARYEGVFYPVGRAQQRIVVMTGVAPTKFQINADGFLEIDFGSGYQVVNTVAEPGDSTLRQLRAPNTAPGTLPADQKVAVTIGPVPAANDGQLLTLATGPSAAFKYAFSMVSGSTYGPLNAFQVDLGNTVANANDFAIDLYGVAVGFVPTGPV